MTRVCCIAPFLLSQVLSSSTVPGLPCRSDLFKLPRFRERLATSKARRDFARVDPIHDHHRNPHDQRIKNVEEHLVDHDEPIVSLGVLDHAHDRSHEDQDADEVERDHVLLPGCGVAFGRRLLAEARVEDCCCNDEEAEDNDLHDETGDDDVGTHISVIGTVGGGQESGA
jgi:hypothetical protein